jgi:Tfp pilus assembly PilM family ATPase
MSRSVGVELTPAHVRILSLEHAGKTSKILQFHETPIPAGETPWEERAVQALKDACTDSKVPKGRIIASLDSGESILREVSLPFKGDDQIRKTVRFEMESLIHNYTIEQLVVSHYKTGETDKGRSSWPRPCRRR